MSLYHWLRTNFYLSPDEGGSAGAASAASQGASQGAASQAPASTSATTAGGTGGGTSTPSSGAASSSPTASQTLSGQAGASSASPATASGTASGGEYTSIIDVIRGYGATDLATQFANNEHGLLQHLILERARAQQYEPVLRQLQENSAEWQEFLRQKQAAAQARQGQNEPWYAKFGFKPPDWNPAWERQITQDANGNLSVAPGADPSLLQKYREYRAFRQNLAEKFLSNPYEFIQGPVQELAQQIARQEIQQHLGGYQDRVYADQFVNTNPWLFQVDQNGSPITDPRTGQRLLSPMGDAFHKAVIRAQQMGIQDVRGQQEYAMAVVQRDAALVQLRAATPQQQQQQANQQFLQQAGAGANHQGNVGPAQSPAPANGNPPPTPGTATLGDSNRLRELMMRNMVAGGYQPGAVAVN